MRNVTNIFLCCMASADIIVALVPMSVTFAIYICKWGPRDQQDKVGHDVSVAYIIIDISCGTISVLSLTVIAMDRYFAINWPFIHQRVIKPRFATIAVTLVWIIAFLTSLLRLDDDIPRKSLTMLNIVISFMIPLAIMTFCYVNIAIIARQQTIRIAQLTAAGSSLQRRCERNTETTSDDRSSKKDDEGNEGDCNIQGWCNNNSCDHNEISNVTQADANKKNQSRFKSFRRGTINAVTRIKAVGKELKAAKTLGIVMGVFIVTWTPFMSVNIISYMHCYPYTKTCKEMLTIQLVMYLKLLHYLSSAINPCLYVLLNRNWRQAFKRMLCCCTTNKVSGESRTSVIGVW